MDPLAAAQPATLTPPPSWLDGIAALAPMIFTVLVALFGLLVAATWVLWLLGRGRFKPPATNTDGAPSGRPPGLRYVLTDFLTKMISDFQHFFALVIVGVFCWMVCRMTAPGIAVGDFALVEKGLAVVLNTPFGGVVISMISYYFGEQAGRKRNPPASPNDKEPVGLPASTTSSQQAPPPPERDKQSALEKERL